jgi:hypothetical protein
MDLAAGTELTSPDGSAVVVVSNVMRVLAQPINVYNFQVDGDHTYFVDDGAEPVWVHNACTSLIHNDAGLVREAEEAGRSLQPSIDRLTQQLANGNLNPGLGTKAIQGVTGVLEARARDGARVYFRALANGDVQILAKSTKANQDKVIGILLRLFGS